MGFLGLKSEKGFTIIELSVVLAVMLIITSILVPNFSNITEKSRLKSDINSAKIINNAINLYEEETEKNITLQSSETIISFLLKEGYLSKNSDLDPQSKEANWVFIKDKSSDVRIKIELSSSSTEELKNSISEKDKKWIQFSKE